MAQSLTGKTAIVTGGSTELASAVALKLAQNGVNISLCGKQPDLLTMAETKIKTVGGNIISHVCNPDTLEEAESVITKTTSTFGNLDILILISPFWSGGLIHEHNIRTWDLVLNANLREPFLMARAALPFMREQHHGEVMAIGSESALTIYPQDGAFAVAMHGLTALMNLIRAENSEHGIRTHILSPGLALDTPFDAEGKPNLTTEQVAEWVEWLLTRPAHLRGNGAIVV